MASNTPRTDEIEYLFEYLDPPFYEESSRVNSNITAVIQRLVSLCKELETQTVRVRAAAANGKSHFELLEILDS